MKGYSQDLYILAFDHRGTITKGLLGVEGREPTQDEANKVSEMKEIIFDGFLKANEYGITGGDPAILVDETFGQEVQQKATRLKTSFHASTTPLLKGYRKRLNTSGQPNTASLLMKFLFQKVLLLNSH